MNAQTSAAPTITDMQVIPVAGHDSMLLNLSGAHGPFFTRNIVILTRQRRPHRRRRGAGRREDPPDARGRARRWSSAQPIGDCNARAAAAMRRRFADRDAGGRGAADLRPAHHHPRGHGGRVGAARPARPVPRTCRWPRCSAKASSATRSRCSATCSTSATAARPTCRIAPSRTPPTTGSALRHEEALTPDGRRAAGRGGARRATASTTSSSRAACCAGEDEMEAIAALHERFPAGAHHARPERRAGRSKRRSACAATCAACSPTPRTRAAPRTASPAAR